MKKPESSSGRVTLYLFFVFLVIGSTARGQETNKVSEPLPENIRKIVSVSCMPCHSSTGGILSRAELNFDEWNGYTSEKQKDKANKIYKKVSKGAMPPKYARETRPDIIPTSEQIDIIKQWVASLQAGK